MEQPPQAPSAATLSPAEFSRRFGLVIALLAAVIARRFREPRLAGLAVPLWNRVNRLGRRLQRLMVRLAAGPLTPTPSLRASRSEAKQSPAGSPPAGEAKQSRPVLPTGRGWLVRVLGHEAAACASQLEHLLADPEVARLLAQAPTAQRILNPLRRLLGIVPFALSQRPARVVAVPLPVQRPLAFEPPGEIVSRSPGYTWYRVHPLAPNSS